MIAFCTHCWAEVDSESPQCFRCHADLLTDARSYEEKLIAALGHPLPAARVRICWLLGDKHILAAVPHLIELAEHDQDLFVQRAAIEALCTTRDSRALSLLRSISGGNNHFLRDAAKKGVENIDLTKGFDK